MPADSTRATLALEDGCVFTGRSFGAAADAEGEVVFNTSMTGYQEVLTDPSYAGQIVVMTVPHVGNVGVNPRDQESDRPHVAGFIVKEACDRPSNWRSHQSLGEYLDDSGIPGLSGIDTRALVRRLRSAGTMRGVLAIGDVDSSQLVARARAAAEMRGADWVSAVKPDASSTWTEGRGDWGTAVVSGQGLHVVAIDCGAKDNILRHLVDRGVKVTVVPPDVSADDVRALEPDGLFVSNGPGDPAAIEFAAKLVAELVHTLPTFGICLGHQLLGRAIGAETYKLPFGHRGGNQPVKDLSTGKVEITSQNHGFAIDADSLRSAGGEVTHVNLNDGTIEGFRLRDKPVFCVQYHPEASPGPHDASYLFDRFVQMMLETK
ncbi:MAG: glutamine-hydrolyzing carbamoyl-phosphate synthase small subunit [Planctomycetota bacterium]